MPARQKNEQKFAQVEKVERTFCETAMVPAGNKEPKALHHSTNKTQVGKNGEKKLKGHKRLNHNGLVGHAMEGNLGMILQLLGICEKILRSEGRVDVYLRRMTLLSIQSDVLKSKSDVALPAKILPET